MAEFATNEELYAFVDALGGRLRGGELALYGERLHFLLHKVSWTTSSELLAELGGVLDAAARKAGPDTPSESRADVQKCLAAIRSAWPGIRFTSSWQESPPNLRL